jgi:plastocyanin
VVALILVAALGFALPSHGRATAVLAQGTDTLGSEVVAHLAIPAPTRHSAKKRDEKTPPAVIWLTPMGTAAAPMVPSTAILPSTVTRPQTFTLLQKDKMFSPHLLVVPVGSSVAFPNADPFFHNVFSLFDGRRFDLGLYEAGSTRSVVFGREGVSYIFCNIHSEMSAVVISLSTSLYSIAEQGGSFHLKHVPEGDYELHVWVEGQRQSPQEHAVRRVHVARGLVDLGEVGGGAPTDEKHIQHLNKFGRPYEPDPHPIY